MTNTVHAAIIDGPLLATLTACVLLSAAITPAQSQEVGQFTGHADVGDTRHAGSANYDSARDVYTISGGGADMWGRADAFQYVFQPATGDVTLEADIRWLGSGGDRNRKACLVFRQTLEPGSAYVDAATHGDGHIALQWRETAGGETHDAESKVVVSPKTIRLEKRGDEFRMLAAAEGEALRPTGPPFRLPLKSPFYVGLGVCAHDNNKLETVEFSKVKVDKENTAWRPLFNGVDLSGWETYIGPRFNPAKGDFDGEPVGLNHDPSGVFSVVQVDGQPALRISGEEFGGISTLDEFENYHFQLEFKWGKNKYAPRDKSLRDSGILYHATGPHGADWFFWMKSQEFQIQEGDCGDYWGLASEVDVRTKPGPDNSFRYDPDGELRHFGAKSKLNRNVKKGPNGEKPTGQWNTLDLYTHGGDSLHVVNGVLAMALHNSRQLAGGRERPLTKGKIQFESEGAEIYLRNIRIRPLTELPPELRENERP